MSKFILFRVHTGVPHDCRQIATANDEKTLEEFAKWAKKWDPHTEYKVIKFEDPHLKLLTEIRDLLKQVRSLPPLEEKEPRFHD